VFSDKEGNIVHGFFLGYRIIGSVLCKFPYSLVLMSTPADPTAPEPANLAALQSVRLREIGAYLRQVRLDQQQTIEAIAQATFIQAYQLKAIEAGDLNALPQAIYVQGFLKKYAIALNLNGKEIAAGFPVGSP
jgi:hypothetical protein